MVPKWRFFGEFLRPVFSASRVHQVSDLRLKFALRPLPCVEVWQTSNPQRLRLGEEKKKKKKNKRQDENIMVCPIPCGDHKKSKIEEKSYWCWKIALVELQYSC